MYLREFYSTFAQERQTKTIVFLSFLECIPPPPGLVICQSEMLGSPQEVPCEPLGRPGHNPFLQSCPLPAAEDGCCGEAPQSSHQKGLWRSACG